MIIRRCFFLLTFAGIFVYASAQPQPNLDANKAIAPDEFLRLLLPPTEVEARANLFTNWQKGVIFLTQGRYSPGMMFNYDVLNNTLLLLVDGEELSLNPIAVDSILVVNSSYVLINPIILNEADSDLLLLRVYNSSHSSLFRNTVVAKVIDRDTNTAAISKFEYSRNDEIQIDQEQSYFLLNKATGEFHELQGKTKELKKWENGDQVVTFVKDQHLDLKKAADLIQVVQYYEQLTYGVH